MGVIQSGPQIPYPTSGKSPWNSLAKPARYRGSFRNYRFMGKVPRKVVQRFDAYKFIALVANSSHCRSLNLRPGGACDLLPLRVYRKKSSRN